eukprot:10599639-Ditylum_brightwellii.AAC.1
MSVLMPLQHKLQLHPILNLKIYAIHLQKAQKNQKRATSAVTSKTKFQKKYKLETQTVLIMLIYNQTQLKMVPVIQKKLILSPMKDL